MVSCCGTGSVGPIKSPEAALMRIVVVGTSGAGKTPLARRIAALLKLPQIELDAINWQSGWRDLTRHDPEEFVRRVNEAIESSYGSIMNAQQSWLG